MAANLQLVVETPARDLEVLVLEQLRRLDVAVAAVAAYVGMASMAELTDAELVEVCDLLEDVVAKATHAYDELRGMVG